MKKRTLTAQVAKTQEELNHALDSEAQVICITGDLYFQMADEMKRIKVKRGFKEAGPVVALIGLICTAPVAAVALLVGGLLSFFVGRHNEQIKNYDIRIDKVRGRIMLYWNKGKKKVDPKHTTIVFPKVEGSTQMRTCVAPAFDSSA